MGYKKSKGFAGFIICAGLTTLVHFTQSANSIADADTKPDSTITEVPVPCRESLEFFFLNGDISEIATLKGNVNQCRNYLGACSYPVPADSSASSSSTTFSLYVPSTVPATATPAGEGVAYDIIDALVRQVVGVRMNNLYLGINSSFRPVMDFGPNPGPSAPPVSGEKALRSLKANVDAKSLTKNWRTQDFIDNVQGEKGTSSCHEVGACNLYCGEGPSGYRMTAAINATTYKSYPAGIKAEYNDDSGGGGGNIFDSSITGMNFVSFRAKLADFKAKGVLVDQLTDEKGKSPIAALNRDPSAWDGKDLFPGWVNHKLKYVEDWTIDNCGKELASDLDESTYGDDYSSMDYLYYRNMNSLVHQAIYDPSAATTYELNFKSLAWDDMSHLEKGTEGSCDLVLYQDFQKASTISALHTGVLVQYLWKYLDEVVGEINAGKMKLTNQVCKNAARDVLANLNNTLAEFITAEQCVANQAPYNTSNPFVTMKNRCESLEDAVGADQRSCLASALVTYIQNQGFARAAECEVYARAQDAYYTAFVAKAKTGQTDTTFTGGFEYVRQLKSWATTGCIRAAGDFVYDQIANKSARERKDINDAMTDKDKMLGLFQGALMNCFPYAYTAALEAYTTKLGLKKVRIQGFSTAGEAESYRSKKIIRSANKDVPSFEVKGCRAVLPVPDEPSSGNRTQNESSTIFAGLGLMAVGRRRSLWRFGFSGLACALLIFATGCSGISTRGIALTGNYCMGNHGILLTGDQAKECCTAKGSDLSGKVSGKDSTMVDGLGMEARASGNEGGDKPCPASLNSVFSGLIIQTAKADDTASDLLDSLRGLNSAASQVDPNKRNKVTQNVPDTKGGDGSLSSGTGSSGAATAGEIKETSGSTKRADTKDQGGLGPSATAGGKTGGGGGGAGGSSVAAMAGGTTEAAGVAAGGKVAEGLETDTASSVMSGGGGGFGDSGELRADGSVSGDAAKTTDMAFDSGSQSDAKTMLGQDPEDYFTRMDLGENIFVKINKRYRSINLSWVQKELIKK